MKRVLLIDDDKVVTAIYRNLLRAHGDQVEVAINGEDGFKLARSFQPDLILLDLDMPIMTGLQFLRRIRKDHGLRSTPIVVFTGTTLRSRVLSAREAGASVVLHKLRERPHHVVGALRIVPTHHYQSVIAL